jgi:hypothetical protein
MVRRVIDRIPGPEWASLFTGFTDSAFRLETLQHYTEPDEQIAFAKFRAGQDSEMDLTWWTGLARQHAAAGHAMSRVRIVIEPPSDYTRFELLAYPIMAAAGDDIRIISVMPGTWPSGIPREDFWIFDGRDVWVLIYDQAGLPLRAELLDDHQAVFDHLRWRDKALAQAIPVNDYLATRNCRAS